MTVSVNTPTTLNLAPSISGGVPSGVAIATAATFGTVTVNGTQVTYTPRSNYFGPDTFSYTGFIVGSAVPSAPAVVTVNVIGRPDAAADANVAGTISSQFETARRFSGSQLSNYQRRMESLHRGGRASTDVPARSGERSSPVARLRPNPDFSSLNSGLDVQSAGRLVAPFRAVDGESPDTAGGAFRSLPTEPMSSLLSSAGNGTLHLGAAAGAGDASSTPFAGASFWLGGDARFGSRDSTGGLSGTTFKTDGVSAGVDRRFSDRLTLGVGLGYARDKTDIGTDRTKTQGTGLSAAIYGSYLPTNRTFVDAVLGYGTLDLDSDRFVTTLGTLAHSHRSGSQIFGSVGGGYEYRDGALLLSPYGRLDFSVDRLRQTAETGVGQFSVTYFDQTSRTLRSALGLRVESSHEMEFGVAMPRLRVEYQHGFEGGVTGQLAFSDLINGTRYAVNSGAINRNSILLGVGSSFALSNGVTLGIDYQIQRSFTQETSQAISFQVSKELDGKGSFAALLPSLDAPRTPLGIRVDAGYTYDKNVTRGRTSLDRLSDHSYTLDLSKGWLFPLRENTRAVFALSGGVEKFNTYDGLSRLHGGAFGELQYRTSGDFNSPTFALFTRFTGEQFQSDLRDGYRTSTGVSVRKAITDRISLFGALAHNQRTARSFVFTGREDSVRLNADYALTPTSTLYVTGEFRRGDTVSTGRASLASLDIAKVFAADDVFSSLALQSYRFEARTVLATIGYNVPIGRRDSFDLSWRRAQSTSVQSPSFEGASRYVTDQFSLIYLVRF